jgi:hypothetical protein
MPVTPPVADQMNNAAGAEISYQFATNGMIGASATFTNLHYPNPAQVPGLYDSTSRGGAVFYTYRLSREQYVGATYQYQQFLTFPIGPREETQNHSVYLFYTIYLRPRLSLSVSGGPQLSEFQEASIPALRVLSPAFSASLGWQGHHAGFAATYSRTVNSGFGLRGAFHSNTASASGSWQWARTWNIGSGVGYSVETNLEGLSPLANPGGHTLWGSASIQHQLGQHVSVSAGYNHLHQSYGSVPAISTAPDTNRGFISISYQFLRPLGR